MPISKTEKEFRFGSFDVFGCIFQLQIVLEQGSMGKLHNFA